ncbi:MAG: peroxide stress protein YaaA [Lysobacterales bacterium]
MSHRLSADALLIIPCCARKQPGGAQQSSGIDPLAELVSPDRYAALINARREVIGTIRADPRFTSEKYSKNKALKDGVEFGGRDASGAYLPALQRYEGTLYGVPNLKGAIERAVGARGAPRIIILSALYGPLHPLSPIQDYNLMMQDAPARTWRKAFPAFLADYVRRNAVSRIALYLGSSTTYLKVATSAVIEVRNAGLISEAVQYHIVDGSTRKTPLKHGERMLCDLGGQCDSSLGDPTQIRVNAV